MLITISDFCFYCIAKYGNPILLDEETLAGEFVSFFKISSLPNLIEIQQLVKDSIGEIEAASLPMGLPGFHFSNNDSIPVIRYDLNSWRGRKEH